MATRSSVICQLNSSPGRTLNLHAHHCPSQVDAELGPLQAGDDGKQARETDAHRVASALAIQFFLPARCYRVMLLGRAIVGLANSSVRRDCRSVRPNERAEKRYSHHYTARLSSVAAIPLNRTRRSTLDANIAAIPDVDTATVYRVAANWTTSPKTQSCCDVATRRSGACRCHCHPRGDRNINTWSNR